ncbi:hypothetical protein pb186bvf_007675 [Paramecium bursaria]
MYKPKSSKPLIPKLQNLGNLIEIQQPLSCRQQKSQFFNVIHNSIKTSRKENISQHKRQPSQPVSASTQKPTRTKTPEKTDDLYYQIIKQRTQSKVQYCHLHPSKKAKFFIHPNNKKLLCSICAIQEAYDGKAIIWQMDNNEQIPKRIQEDEWTIENLYPTQSEKYKRVQDLQKFLHLAKQLYESAKQCKENQIQSHNVIDIVEEIHQISKDILANVKNIVDNLDQRPFQLILQKYLAKLVLYEKLLKEPNQKNKQVYVSFQNRENFMAMPEYTQIDSVQLRSSEEQKIINEFYTPNF